MATINPLSCKIMRVAHLGSEIAYHQPKAISNMKPTVIMVNSALTSATLWRPQLADKTLADNMNLIAIEPLGHGNSKCTSPTFTYWDIAIANLQVMEALGIKRAFIMGISQGGLIAARMAMYAPDKIIGLITINSSMDVYNERMASHKCEDPSAQSVIDLASKPDSSFALPPAFFDDFFPRSFGPSCTEQTTSFWTAHLNKVYAGEPGRLKLREIAINITTRDSLVPRLSRVKCPVLWLVGSEDKLFTLANAEDEIKMFTASRDASVKTVDGGPHLMSWTHAEEVNRLVAEFVGRYGGKVDARALREAVGMVEM